MQNIRNPYSGFTLIEMVMAIVVFGVAMGLFSRGLQSIGEKSVLPTASLQSIWIARSYLDEIAVRVDEGLSGCTDQQTVNLERRKGYPLPRSGYRSLCDYRTDDDQEIASFSGEIEPHLSDYRIGIKVEKLDSKAEESIHRAIGQSENRLSGSMVDGYRVVAKVTHPDLSEIKLERWVWVKQ